MQGFNALLGLTHPLVAFKLERFGHNANGQNAQFTRRLGDDRGRSGAGAAAHASGDKAHVRACQMIHDLFNAFLGRRGAHCGPRPRAQPFGHFDAQLHPAFRLGLLQGLRVSVCHHEFDAFKRLVDHVVDRVAACPTHTENGDPWFQVVMPRHGKIECHNAVRLFMCPRSQAYFATNCG